MKKAHEFSNILVTTARVRLLRYAELQRCRRRDGGGGGGGEVPSTKATATQQYDQKKLHVNPTA